MKPSLFKKQIPTLIALVILFIGAGAGVVLVGQRVPFLPRAAPEHTPKQLKITNVSDRSFSVSWVTDEATTGFIQYGTTDSLGTTITDDRDQLSGQAGNYQVHHVTVRGLTANTNYFFKIGSGPSSSLYDNNGQAYQVTTGQTLGAPEEPETAYGQVVTSAQTPAEGSIVYLDLNGAAPLSTLVKSSGSWAISLSTARNRDLTQYLTYDRESAQINLQVIGPDGGATNGTTTTGNDQPVPTITLGQSFEFGSDSAPATTTETSDTQTQTTTLSSEETTLEVPRRDPEATQSGFDLSSLGAPIDNFNAEIELLNPSQDGEQINTSRPEIQGEGPANTQLNILVHSPTAHEGTVTTDVNGDFAWSPPADLEPGEHTVTISYLDEQGIEQFFRRTFFVYAQGESELPALTSTPSGSPTPTPVPTSTPIPTATPVPTSTATPSSTPRVSQPSTESGVPVAGIAMPTLLSLFMGFGFIVTGLGMSYQFSQVKED